MKNFKSHTFKDVDTEMQKDAYRFWWRKSKINQTVVLHKKYERGLINSKFLLILMNSTSRDFEEQLFVDFEGKGAENQNIIFRNIYSFVATIIFTRNAITTKSTDWVTLNLFIKFVKEMINFSRKR